MASALEKLRDSQEPSSLDALRLLYRLNREAANEAS
jgi:hypothetical protein